MTFVIIHWQLFVCDSPEYFAHRAETPAVEILEKYCQGVILLVKLDFN